MANSRRQQAQADMGMNFEREDQQRETALAKEQERQAEKEAKREALMTTTSYRIMDTTAKYMDKYFLDPIIGLIPGGIGDVLSSFLALPFIYFALVQVKSIPLTLAVETRQETYRHSFHPGLQVNRKAPCRHRKQSVFVYLYACRQHSCGPRYGRSFAQWHR